MTDGDKRLSTSTLLSEYYEFSVYLMTHWCSLYARFQSDSVERRNHDDYPHHPIVLFPDPSEEDWQFQDEAKGLRSPFCTWCFPGEQCGAGFLCFVVWPCLAWFAPVVNLGRACLINRWVSAILAVFLMLLFFMPSLSFHLPPVLFVLSICPALSGLLPVLPFVARLFSPIDGLRIDVHSTWREKGTICIYYEKIGIWKHLTGRLSVTNWDLEQWYFKETVLLVMLMVVGRYSDLLCNVGWCQIWLKCHVLVGFS